MSRRVILLVAILLLIAGGFLAFQFVEYRAYSEVIHPGIAAGGVELGGKNREEALDVLDEMLVGPLSKPLHLRYGEEAIILVPADVGFVVHTEGMTEEAWRLSQEQGTSPGFFDFILRGPQGLEVEIPLDWEVDEDGLRSFLIGVAQAKDQPLRGVQPITGTLSFYPGQPGWRLDVDGSLPRVVEALTSFGERGVDLVVEVTEPPPPSLDLLQGMVEYVVEEFPGLVGIYISDLESGESLEVRSQVAFSGMSVVKVAILLETYLHFAGEEPDQEAKGWMDKVVTDPVGSNYWANLLLELAGEGSATDGARRTAEMLWALGLNRSFIKGPYRLETEEVGRRGGSGLASSLGRGSAKGSFQDTNPDPMIQTSPQDMGRLLEMIYWCGYGGGAILDTFSGMITPQGCQEIQEILAQNPVRSMIGAGIPEGIRLAHKHGFAEDTHADAGIVYSPGGDYVIVQFQYAPTEWLVWALSQPVFEAISRATYNFFNLDQPFLP